MIEISELISSPKLVNELTSDELFSVDAIIRTEINKLRNEYSNKNNLIPKNIIDQYNSYMSLLDVIFKKLVEVDEQDKPVTDDNYHGQHSAPTNESGSPIWNVCLNGIYPDDFYVRTREYIYMDSDHKGLQYVLSYRNKPNRQIRIFRAVPKSVEKPIISVGDWVTVDRSYAYNMEEKI